MYLLKLNIVKHCLLVKKNDEEAWLWHRRMCHQSAHTVHGMVKGNHAIWIPSSSKFEHKCSFCLAGKHARAPFPKETEFRASKPLELVYVNICGLVTQSTINGEKYFLLIVDDFSRLMWLEILKNKSEVFSAFQKFKTLVESKSNEALSSVWGLIVVENFFQKNSQTSVKRKASKAAHYSAYNPTKWSSWEEE